MRTRTLTIPALGRAAGFVLVAAAIVLAVVHVHQNDTPARLLPATTLRGADPVAAEMARCRAIGMDAKDDAACEATWTENRRRFFTYRPSDSTSPAVSVQPATAKSEGR